MKMKHTVRRLSTDEYICNYLDLDMTHQACLRCDQYGKSWNCPPFESDYIEQIRQYPQAVIVSLTLEAEEKDGVSGISELNEKSLPFRMEIEKRLRNWEKRYGGMCFTTIGKCNYCGNNDCARKIGCACRHPELVRPSLESIGFNLVKTSEELLGIPMKWNFEKGRVQPNLNFIFGYFKP